MKSATFYYSKTFLTNACLLLCTLLAVLSCETDFSALQENDTYRFSVYGLLDVNADTQWVRVIPIQDKVLVEAPELNEKIEVTLTRESDGKMISLHDSLFSYSSLAYAWNFWTTEPILPEETYTLRVESQEGESCYAVATTPKNIPKPKITYQTGEEKGSIEVSGIEDLAVVETTFILQVVEHNRLSAEFPVSLSHLETAYVSTPGSYYIDIDAWPMLEAETITSREKLIIRERSVVVASASEDWPDLADIDEQQLALPEVATNVVNGTGLVAGIASWRGVPLKSCFDGAGNLIACEFEE
ncbi:hypothetical protein [Rhodohalobacter sp. 614A]|uniref:hypothetical protein n=1 Tax=Rhodohalobacter sp. 614A TaxID=2908649 RepID=UPI001F2EBA65|nr:hypothetical protein [Rhodohalobacter sp. 614A]